MKFPDPGLDEFAVFTRLRYEDRRIFYLEERSEDGWEKPANGNFRFPTSHFRLQKSAQMGKSQHLTHFLNFSNFLS